jgi:2-oxoglutarate ferredoxin oxidoreductase subunit beta
MLYMCENNGVYGLTKGQFSASADIGTRSKKGEENQQAPVDPCLAALSLGGTFIARSFSGDREQLVPLIQAGLRHKGFAMIDIISPCVTFNNNPGSTKSYDYVREHIEATSTVDFVPMMTEITTSYDEGSATTVRMHDGSSLLLNKLDPRWDPCDRSSAVQALHAARNKGEVLTGLLFVDSDSRDLHDTLHTSDTPLNALTQAQLCPGSARLADINASLR